jgi:hypothetical protein
MYMSQKSIYADPTPPGPKSWVWFPSCRELGTHYVYELGFLSCCTVTLGSTVYWISGFTGLPGIYGTLHASGHVNSAYWMPQIIGGFLFVLSAVMFMAETQKHWWLPAPGVLGWHISAWNLIGGVGFTMSALFGFFATHHWAAYQASCSTFWG